MDKIKNLGWPYNLYSAISGLNVPDSVSMSFRSYYYKYQKGYYCFFFTEPAKANELMMQFLSRFYNHSYRVIGLAVIMHRYGFGKSYDEIVDMYNKKKNASFYQPIYNFDRYFVKFDAEYVTVDDLVRHEIKTLYEMRTYHCYSDYLMSWPAGIKQPEYRKFVTLNDRLKLNALSNRNFKYGAFIVDSSQLVSKGINFSEYLTNIIDSDSIISILDDNDIFKLEDLCTCSINKVTSSMEPDDIDELFNRYLKQIGINMPKCKISKLISNARVAKRKAERIAKKAEDKRLKKQISESPSVTTVSTPSLTTNTPKSKQNSKPTENNKPKTIPYHIKYSNPFIQYLYDLFRMIDNEEIEIDDNDSAFYHYAYHCFIGGYRYGDLLVINAYKIHQKISYIYEDVYRKVLCLPLTRIYKAFDILSIIDVKHKDNCKTRYTFNKGYVTAIAIKEELARKCLENAETAAEYLDKHGYGSNVDYYKEKDNGMHPFYDRVNYNFDHVCQNALYDDIADYFNEPEPEYVDYDYLNKIGIGFIPDSDELYDQ